MKVKAVREFVDKNNFTLKYSKGEVYDFDEVRAKELIEKGLVESIKSEKSDDGNTDKLKGKKSDKESSK